MSDISENEIGPPTTTVIHENGDVLFEVGSKVRLLVLSQALAMASPVFNAMFAHGFSEGQHLSTASPRTIPLPDDDPGAVTLLCQILHFRTTHSDFKLEPKRFLDLAILFDKYDCIGAVRAWSMVCVRKLASSTNSLGVLSQLVVITYTLDLPEEFQMITKIIMKDYGELPHRSCCGLTHELLPGHIADIIRNEKQSLIIDAIANIEKAMLPPSRSRFCSSIGDSSIGDIIGKWVQNLNVYQLWPMAQRMRELSIVGFYKKLSQLPNSYTHSCTNPCSCNAEHPIKKQVIEALSVFLDDIEGLCLDCLKHGTAEGDSQCRIYHYLK